MVGIAPNGIDLTKEWPPLSIKRVARVFDVHRRTIEKWFDRGLESIQVGGKIYTTRAALQRFGQLRGNEQIQQSQVDQLATRQERARAAAVTKELNSLIGVK